VGLGLLAFVALLPLLCIVDSGASPARAGAAGWLSGVVLFGCALAWVPLSGFGGILLAVAIAYVLLVAVSLAAWCAAVAWLRERDRALALALAPLLWVAVEFARSRGTLGYPWHHLGYALASFPVLIQLASLGGIYLLSLWIAAVNTAAVALRHAPRRAALVVGALIAGPLAFGLQAAAPGELAETLRVAAVQPHVAEPGRVAQEGFQANLRTLLDLTDGALRGSPDLVVWPESAYERTVGAGGDPFLGAIARHYGTPLLTGVWRRGSGPSPMLHNSVALVDPDGGVALAGDKLHPVPFYEGIPATLVERALARLLPWPGRFRAGERPALARLERPGQPPLRVGVVICLDSSYPGLVRDLRRRGARLLVEISNESLTGEWSAHQHALVSRLRAVENGLPLVRVGNIGPSEWVDRSGRLLARLPPGAMGAQTRSVPLAEDPPPYVFLGDAPVFAGGLIPAIAVVLRRRRARAPCRSNAKPVTRQEGDLLMTVRTNGASPRMLAAAALVTIGVHAAPARAADGMGFSAETYYEEATASISSEPVESTRSGLPTALHFSDSSATVEYASTPDPNGGLEWTAKIRGLLRSHERVDAVYHMIAVLPLPVDAERRPGFRPLQFAIAPREGVEGASVPLIYSGEKVRLKRSVALERSLLPNLVGEGADKLPSLAGTGYEYSLWDTIIRYDPEYGDTVQLFADFRYSTDAEVPPPDARDDRLKAYVVTWIPALDSRVLPFAIRMDVRDPQ
jgi:apolipoprotein N-acyltransferase